MLQNYIKFALRSLAKNKVSAGINLLGLALGITACLSIFLIANFELSYDRFHPDSDRIYRVVGQSKMGKDDAFRPIGFIPRAAPAAIREEVAGLETVAAFHNVESDVIIPDGSATGKRLDNKAMSNKHGQIILAEPQYFDIFQYEWLAGNPKTALNAPNKVVLTEPKARLYFGDIPVGDMIGKEVIYRDSIHTEVTGIVQAWEQNTDFTFTDFISHSTINASPLKGEINLQEWNDIWSASQAFVKLDKGSTVAQVEAQLQLFSNKHFGPDHGTRDLVVIPKLQALSDLHYNYDYQDNYSRKAHLPTLYGLMGVALFILLIATINFINLATARSVQRAREIGMRKVLGSSRKALMAQFMGETFILTTAAVGVALVATPWVFVQFKSFIPSEFHFSIFSLPIGLFVLGITALTTLLAGFYPSWVLSAYQPAATLKGQSMLAGNEKGYLRKGLIVFQFTVSLLFIIGTIVVGHQLDFIRNKDLGFSSNAVVLLDLPPDDKNVMLAQQIRQLSGVEYVATEWFPPLGEGYMLTKLTYRGATTIESEVSAKVGDENFIPLYGLHLIAGSNFRPTDTLRELVINEKYAQTLGFQQPADALGKLLEFNGRNYPIVGVVANFHEETLHAPIKPSFIAYLPNMSKNISVKLSTSNVEATLASIAQQCKAMFPEQKFAYTFLDESIAKLYEKEQKTAQLIKTATAIAILISCMGLFGLITFMAEQRRKEIGVRKVLGASVASITGLLTRDFLKLVLIALVIASPIAYWAMQKWLADFAYRIDMQWWMFIGAGLAAMLIAFLTVGLQSVRAALANPVKSLRSE